MHTNPPNGVIVATTPDEHRFYRLCAEWDLNPHARKQIRQEILANPGWRIEVDATGRPYLGAKATVTAKAETIQNLTELEGRS